MKCPYCSPGEQAGSKVLESRPQEDGGVVRRRRKCNGPSGHRFTTYEKLADAGQGLPEDVAPSPVRRRMPRERKAVTHKFSLGGYEAYITAGMFEDGTVGEIFLSDIGKEG